MIERAALPIPDYIQVWWTDHKLWDAWRVGNFEGPMPAFKCRRW